VLTLGDGDLNARRDERKETNVFTKWGRYFIIQNMNASEPDEPIFSRKATSLQKAGFRGLLWAAITNLSVLIFSAIGGGLSRFVPFLLEPARNLALLLFLPLLFFSTSFIMSERKLAILGILLAFVSVLIALAMPTSNY